MAVLTLGRKMKTTKRQNGNGRSNPSTAALCRLTKACDAPVCTATLDLNNVPSAKELRLSMIDEKRRRPSATSSGRRRHSAAAQWATVLSRRTAATRAIGAKALASSSLA